MDTGNCSVQRAHPLARSAAPVYTLFSRAGNRGLKYRDSTPRSSRPRSMSAERAHANIICESSVFRPGPRDTAGFVRARGIHKIERRNRATARRRGEGRVRLVLPQMDHCSKRWFDDHPRQNKTIETPGDLRCRAATGVGRVGRLDLSEPLWRMCVFLSGG